MGCCEKIKESVTTGKAIVKSYTTYVTGKKCKYTDARIRICRKCEKNYWVGRTLWCKLCKCYMPGKARFLTNECPIGKWKLLEKE